MFRSFTVPQCSHQHCVQPVAGDVEVVGSVSGSHKGLSPCDFDLIPKMKVKMLVTTLKDSKTSKHVSILYQL